MSQSSLALREHTVAIVGMGLLGGSLALALRGHCARIVGVVAPGDETAAAEVRALDIVDEVVTLEAAAGAADVVVLAAPVRTIITLVEQLGPLARAQQLITDVGSTKREVVAAMSAAAAKHGSVANWIGGHPMAGGTTAGLGAIDAELFRGATWAICPPAQPTTIEGRSLLDELVRAVGAKPVLVTPDDHDRAVAISSHLPHVVASALATLELPDAQLAGRGWARATEAAAGDPAMWRDILATNGDNVADAVRDLATRLEQVASSLDSSSAS